MKPLVMSLIIFALVIGGVLLGSWLRKALPHQHLSKDSQDAVRLGVGLISTIAALVLGLLISSAKGTFDTQSGQVKQITTDVILLDQLLADYGREALPVRQQIRSTMGPSVDRLWHEKLAASAAPFASIAAAEKVYQEILALAPHNDSQKSLQARAVQVANDFAQTRLLLFTETGNNIPAPFVAILVFWLVIIFASYSLFVEMNVTTFTCLAVFALSASCALYLILELSEPFTGLMKIPSAPLRDALGPIVL